MNLAASCNNNMFTNGSVIIIDGGFAGVQGSPRDKSALGYKIYLIEKKSTAIDGVIALLHKTFPTNDCSLFIPTPTI